MTSNMIQVTHTCKALSWKHITETTVKYYVIVGVEVIDVKGHLGFGHTASQTIEETFHLPAMHRFALS